jgi:hypothetical protein
MHKFPTHSRGCTIGTWVYQGQRFASWEQRVLATAGRLREFVQLQSLGDYIDHVHAVIHARSTPRSQPDFSLAHSELPAHPIA